MGRIRVLYTDIDGTMVGPLGNLLWDSGRSPTTTAADALVRAASEGLEIVPLTGRSRHGMFELARVLGLPTYFCELGAVRVYDRGAEVVVDRGAGPPPDGEGRLESTFAALQRGAMALMAAFPGRLEPHTPWNEGRDASFLVRGGIEAGAAEAVLAEAGLGWASCVDNGVLPRRFESMPDVERAHVYHLTPQGVSKAAAIAADQARRGLSPSECAMVGDAAADVDCRSEVGRCFLVRNGLLKDPGLRWVETAGSGVEVTGSTHGGGFAEVVHQLLDEA